MGNGAIVTHCRKL